MNRPLIAVVLFLSVILGASVVSAVSLPGGEALFETSLQDRISSSDTMMTLAANSLRGSQTISGYHCFTIDEGRSDSEYVCGTVSGTTVSSLERGLSLVTATTTVASLQVQHRKGADVKITDYPLIQRIRNVVNGSEGLPNKIGYASHPDFSAALGTTIPDITYVAALVGGGAGIPLSVNIGGTGAITLPAMLLQGNGTNPITGTSSPSVAAIFATSTATSTFAGPVNFTNTSVSTSTFSGNVQIQGNASTTGNAVFNGSLKANATTTLTGSNVNSNALCINGVCYQFPSAGGSSGQALSENGSHVLSWSSPSTGAVSTTTSFAAPTSAGGSATKSIFCTNSKVAISGGWSGIPVSSGNAAIVMTQSQNNVSDPTRWDFTASCNTSGTCTSGTITVYAMCVNP